MGGRSVLSLDLKAHTSKALSEFKSFSDNLERKFFVSGLKVDLLKQTLSDINREFDKAMGNPGLTAAMELKQLETSGAAVFSVLKGGSLEAGREMAKNIREALGNVSKTISSTNEDINAVMRMVPFTSKALLDKANVSMEDFHSKNLAMITNARDAMGEDASKVIEGLLSGTTTQTDLLNDKTGIGQMIRTQVGAFDPSAMSPEARTEKVLQILQNDDFQSVLAGLAEDNAGFMKVVRSFRNTLFDQRTGVFGILKESTLSLREFSGDRVTQTTSLFEETTRLFRVVFGLEDGLFARIARVFGEVFGFNAQNFTDILIKTARWVTNTIYKLSNFFNGPDFKNFVEGLKGIIDFFVEGARSLAGLFGATPGGLGAALSGFVGNLGSIMKSISGGNWQEAGQTAVAGIQSGATNLVEGLKALSVNVAEGAKQLNIKPEDISLGGGAVGAMLGTAIMPGIGTLVGGVVGAALGDDAVAQLAEGAKEISVTLIGGAIDTITNVVKSAGGWDAIGEKTALFITNIGTTIVDGLKSVTAKLTSAEVDTRGLLSGVGKIFGAIFAQGLTIVNQVLDSLIALKNTLGPEGLRPIGAALAKMFMAALPVIVKGFGFVLGMVEEVLAGFFSELLKVIVPLLNPVSWVARIASGIARLLGLDGAADAIDRYRKNIDDSIAKGVGEIAAKLVLIFNPGGILTKVLGKIPVFGNLLNSLYKLFTLQGLRVPGGLGKAFNKALDTAFKGAARGLRAMGIRFGKEFTEFSANGLFRFLVTFKKVLKGAIGKALAKIPIIGGMIDFALNMGEGNSVGRAATRAGTGMAGAAAGAAGGAAIGTMIMPGPGTAIGGIIGGIGGGIAGNDFLGKWISDRLGANKHLGNIPEYARASNGLNMLAQQVSREQENVRPSARPVIANSDEIIIPPGRLREMEIISKEQVEQALRTTYPQLEGRSLARLSEMMAGAHNKTDDRLESMAKDILGKITGVTTTQISTPTEVTNKIQANQQFSIESESPRALAPVPVDRQRQENRGVMGALGSMLGGLKSFIASRLGINYIDYGKLDSLVNSTEIISTLGLINETLKTPAEPQTLVEAFDYDKLSGVFNSAEIISTLGLINERIDAVSTRLVTALSGVRTSIVYEKPLNNDLTSTSAPGLEVSQSETLLNKDEGKDFLALSKLIAPRGPSLSTKQTQNEELLSKYLLDLTSANKDLRAQSGAPTPLADLGAMPNLSNAGIGATSISPDPKLQTGLSQIGESIFKYGKESEDTWQKSTDSASQFFREFEYKTGTEWKNTISKPINVAAPSVQVDTAGINSSIQQGLSGINFGEIMSKIPEGMSSGWNNVVEFFKTSGEKAKELIEDNPLGKLNNWFKGLNPFNRGQSPEALYNGNRLNTASSGFNLAGFTAAAQEEVLNAGMTSNIVVANDTEIIAPKSSLNQLASLLLRQSSVGKNSGESPGKVENHNTFYITGVTDPEEVATAVMQRMDTIFSQKMMNNRVPHA